jgi:predicted Fe-Mo cluster-binding NifX family protein
LKNNNIAMDIKKIDMKIAVASDNRINIANHFGRTLGFLIYTIDNNEIKDRVYIENDFTGHAQGQHHDHDHDHSHGPHHSHHGIMEALKECGVVISRGMGRRLLDDFEEVGKKVYITWTENADDAVKQYLEGVLGHDPEKSCQH